MGSRVPADNKVESFSGTVPPGGVSTPPIKFTASKTGEIAVKVLTLTPAAVPAIGMQWTQAGDGSCNGGVLQAAIGTAGTTAISNQIVSGNYCLILYDYIDQAVTANYSLTVSHP